MHWRGTTILAVTAVLLCGEFPGHTRAAESSQGFSSPFSILDGLHARGKNTVCEQNFDGMRISGKDSSEAICRTTKVYNTPLIITAKVKTNSTNIRLYFAKRGMIIFNWEVNQQELRFHNPATGQQIGTANQGHVVSDTWVDIRWTIDTHESRVEVNGVERGKFEGDYSNLSGDIGVGTAAGAVITLRSLTVALGGELAIPSTINFDEHPGPTTRIARAQTEIKALYVVESGDSEVGGLASELILTSTPGTPKDVIPIGFTVSVGPEMNMVLDDVIRALGLKYPAIDGTTKLELSFEDKYTPKDGGSIGAAIGTVILSAIQGFDVDPQVAMTGDVSADGKIRKIGGVGLKLRGAMEAGCTIVALPTENLDQLIDAMIYNGPGLISGIQAIGISDLDSAVAVARNDRDEKLAKAIFVFSQIQDSLKESPRYWQTPAGQAKLRQVLELAPQHLSAKLLLAAAQNKQRRHLTATASLYYIFTAIQNALPTLLDQQKSGEKVQLMPESIEQGLRDLHNLRPMADVRIQPLIDAWSEFIQAWSDAQSGQGSYPLAESKRQALLATMNKLNANRELAQKMLQEGI